MASTEHLETGQVAAKDDGARSPPVSAANG
jgi:hypothetical protein